MFWQGKDDPLAGKRLEQVFQHYSLAFWSGLVISAMPVLALWNVSDRVALLGWMLALWLELSVRHVYARRYTRTGSGADYRKWRNRVVAIAAIDGSFWGASVWTFAASPTSPEATLVLLVIASVALFDGKELAGVPTAAAACLSTTLAPVALWLFSFNTPLTTLMGIGTLGYLGLMLVFSRHNYDAICRLVSSAERNEVLAAAQRENEQRMARYFESAPGYFYTLVHRPDGRYAIPFASPGIRGIFGLEPEGVAQDISALVALNHPDDSEMIFRKTEESERDLMPFHTEYRIIHPQKGLRWIEANALPQRMADGGTRWDGFMHDITERKQAEQQLKEALIFNEGIINAIPDILFEVDREGRYLNFWTQDPVAREVQKTALLGKTVHDVLSPESAEAAMAAIREADEKGFAYGKAIPVVQPDGKVRWYEHSLSKKQGSSPSEATVLALSRDVTERKRMEESLRARENEYRTLAENFPEIVIRYDRDCRRIYVNPAFEGLAGKTAGEMIGKSPLHTSPLLDQDGYMAMMRQVLESGVMSSGELPVRKANGETAWYMSSFVPEFDTAGKLSGVLMVARDITERIRMEQALQESEAQYRHKSNLLLSILESASSVGIYAVDRDYRYIAFNRLMHEGAKRLWGADIAVGMSMLDAIDTDAHREFCRQGFDYVLAGNNFFIESKEEVVKEGVTTFEYHDNYASPIRDDNGEVIGLTVFTTNITERKHLEVALQESEAQYRYKSNLLQSMFDSQSSIGIYALDREYRYLAFNRLIGDRAQYLLGSEIAVGMSILEAIKDDAYREFCRQGFDYVLAGNNFFVESRETVIEDGKTAYEYHENYGSPIRDDNGEVIGLTVFVTNITERKRMEDALRAREHEYRTLAENFPDIVIRYDRDCRRIYVNRRFTELAGVVQEEAIGKMPQEGSPLIDVDGYMVDLREAMKRGVSVDREFTVRGAGGEIRWCLGRFVPEFDAAGAVVGGLAVASDITERKRMEAALQESEAQYRYQSNLLHALMDSASDVVVYALDRNYRYLSFNRKHGETFKRLWGKDIAVGMSIFDVISNAAFAEFCRRGFDHVLAGHSAAIESREEVVKDDRPAYEYWENYGSPIRNDDGEVIGLTVFAVDVTQRRQAEQQLQQALEFTEGIINAIPDVLLEVNREGRYLNVWTQKPELLAAQKAMLLGKTVHEVLPPEAAEIALNSIREADEKGLSFGNVIRIDLPIGTRWFEQSVSRKPGTEGGDARFIALSRDVTERQQAEIDLRESRAQLRGLIVQRESAREEERKLIAREVHDELGQILTGLKLNVAAVGRKFAADSEPLREQVREIAALTETAIGVARNISSVLRPAGLDMGVLAAMNWQAERWSAHTGIACDVRSGKEEIHLDEKHAIAVFRIVQESLTNIARHAQADRVRICLARDADDYVLAIRDNGIGFDMQSRKAGSFGLVGMQERALMLGGTLSINSKPGGGTEITVRIPAHQIKEEV